MLQILLMCGIMTMDHRSVQMDMITGALTLKDKHAEQVRFTRAGHLARVAVLCVCSAYMRESLDHVLAHNSATGTELQAADETSVGIG